MLNGRRIKIILPVTIARTIITTMKFITTMITSTNINSFFCCLTHGDVTPENESLTNRQIDSSAVATARIRT